MAVYHHPWLPRLAVLQPGNTPEDLVAGAGALVLLALGLSF